MIIDNQAAINRMPPYGVNFLYCLSPKNMILRII